MTARSPHAFFLSAALHALAITFCLILAYGFRQEAPPPTRMFELVAGEGDNYTATAAPALGSPDVKLNVPNPPKIESASVVAPAPVEPAPITPAAPPKKAETMTPAKPTAKSRTFAQQIRRDLIVADSKAKLQAAKERKLEADRLAKEEAAKKAAVRAPKVDAVGIAKGVLGGSTENKVGGAGGKALTAEEGTEAERYKVLLEQRLKEQLDQMPGLDDGLSAEAELHVMADGRVTRPQITKSSGNDAFDLAVLRAIRAVQMPPRPKGVDEVLLVPFSTRAKL